MVARRWLVLAALFVARTALALQFQSVASAGPLLISAFSIDYAALGLLIGLHSLPGVAIALPGGLVGQKFGAVRVALFGLVLMVLGGLIIGEGGSFAVAAIGRAVLGTGAVLFNVLATKLVADWFSGREIATAMGLLVSSWPLGIALGLLVLGPVGATWGWSAIMHASTACVLAGLITVALVCREAPVAVAPAAPRLGLDLDRREWTLVCLAGVVWALFNVAYIVFISFGPELFVHRGFSPVVANLIVSFLGWTLIASIPLSSLIVERFGRPRVALVVAFVLVAAGLAILPFVGDVAMLVAFALIVASAGIPPGLIMAMPAEALRPQSRSSGMGVYYTWYYAGMAVLPGGAGLLRDITGSVAAPALFAAVMCVLCVIAVLAFQAVQRRPLAMQPT